MIRAEGEGLAENLYRLVGDGMRGTEALAPTAPLPLGMRTIGSHRLEFLSVPGHTQSDIAILDHSTGVLFAIDQVFNQRTPTLPNANLANSRAGTSRAKSLSSKRSKVFCFVNTGKADQTCAWLNACSSMPCSPSRVR